MTFPAVRTVSETDDFRLIEGLAYPFKGRDTYGTFFSARTDFHWGLYSDVAPGATRAAKDAKFVRPVTFHHGFDPEIGLERMGGWSPVRMDADGIWVQAQIDKRGAYYANRIGPLLDAGALGLSGGSAEHSVRIDDRSGEVLDWPAYELAFTPTESNPLAQIAARSGEAGASLRIVAALADLPLDAVIEAPAKPAVRAYSEAASDAAMGAGALGTLLYILGAECDEPDQVAMIQASIDSLVEWLNAERAEVGTPGEDATDTDMDAPVMAAMSGTRAGARNSEADQAHVDAIHTHAVALGASAHSDTPASDSGDDAARSGDPLPTTFRVVERVDPAALRAELLADARQAGEDAARRLTG
jgi:hypothetical protein